MFFGKYRIGGSYAGWVKTELKASPLGSRQVTVHLLDQLPITGRVS
jgi:hypothetical protein